MKGIPRGLTRNDMITFSTDNQQSKLSARSIKRSAADGTNIDISCIQNLYLLNHSLQFLLVIIYTLYKLTSCNRGIFRVLILHNDDTLKTIASS